MLAYLLGAISFPIAIFLLLMSSTRTPITKNVSFHNDLGSTSTGSPCRVVVPRRSVYYGEPLVLDNIVDEHIEKETMKEFTHKHTFNGTSVVEYDCFALVDTESWSFKQFSDNFDNKEFYEQTIQLQHRRPLWYQPVTAIKFVRHCFYQPNSTVQCEITAIHKELFGRYEVPHEEYLEAIIYRKLEKLHAVMTFLEKKLNIDHRAEFNFEMSWAHKLEVAKTCICKLVLFKIIYFAYKLVDSALYSIYFAVMFMIKTFKKLVGTEEKYFPGPYNLRHHHFGNQSCSKLNCVNKAMQKSRIKYISKDFVVK